MGGVKAKSSVPCIVVLPNQYVMQVLPSVARSTEEAEVIVAQAFPDMLSGGMVVTGMG